MNQRSIRLSDIVSIRLFLVIIRFVVIDGFPWRGIILK